ncbi:MAG: alpha/beta hydrolase [Pseudomonadota bacterium]
MFKFRKTFVLMAAALSFAWAMSNVARADYVELSSDLTVHYETAGTGDITIIFIPGWLMSTDVFEHQLDHFKDSTAFTALAYDPRGQGRSSKTLEGHTYQQHGRDLAALIDALDLDKVILAGWSYGVTEQLAYLDQFGSDKLVGMVLIDTGPDVAGESYDEWVWYLRDDSDEYSRWFTEGIVEDRQAVIASFAEWMLEDPSPENIAWVSDIANMTPGTVASSLNATGFYLDYTEDLVALEGQIPLLYVTREEWQPVADPWIKANTPSAQAEYLGKHMMFWERPDEFNQILDAYLAQF